MIEQVIGIIILLFLLLILGAPVAFAMLIAGITGLFILGDYYSIAGILKSAPYEHVASYTMSTLPMFILMAEFLTAGKFTKDIFSASHRWFGHFRGGLTYAAIVGGVLLAAISGSSSAAAGTLAGAAYPEMKRFGYDDSFSTAALACIGTIALMIPPSIGLILYGVFTETSISMLLMAGFLPGAITAVGYFVSINLMVRAKPEIAPRAAKPFTWRERWDSMRTVWPMATLMIFVVVAIYSGIVTPTEIGAVGALLAMLIGVIMRRMGWKEFLDAMVKGTRNSTMILIIIACATVFAVFLTLTGVTQDILQYIKEAQVNRWFVLGGVLFVTLALGFFLDQVAILILTLPLTFPLLTGLDFHPVWLGIVIIKTAEIGLVTPPMGLNVFIVGSVTKVPVHRVFAGVWPFVLVDLIVLLMLIIFPSIPLFLPHLILE